MSRSSVCIDVACQEGSSLTSGEAMVDMCCITQHAKAALPLTGRDCSKHYLHQAGILEKRSVNVELCHIVDDNSDLASL